jgi:hypothetical protein
MRFGGCAAELSTSRVLSQYKKKILGMSQLEHRRLKFFFYGGTKGEVRQDMAANLNMGEWVPQWCFWFINWALEKNRGLLLAEATGSRTEAFGGAANVQRSRA